MHVVRAVKPAMCSMGRARSLIRRSGERSSKFCGPALSLKRNPTLVRGICYCSNSDDRMPTAPTFLLLRCWNVRGGCCCGLRQDTVVNGKEREFKTVRHADLIVDVAQIVLDDLLGGAKLVGDFLVLITLDDERDDLELLRSQAIAHTRADEVVLLNLLGDVRAFGAGLAMGNFAHAREKSLAGDAAEDDAVDTLRQQLTGILAGLTHYKHTGTTALGNVHHGAQVGVEVRRADEHVRAQLLERDEHLFRRLRLRDDANVLFYREYLRDASAKNRLVI